LLAVTLPDVPLDSRTPSVTLCLFSSRCNVDLNRVQLELAREIVPGAQKIGIVNNSIDVKARGQWDEIESVTPNLDIKVTSADVLKPEDIEPAFKKLGAEHVEVVVVLQSNLLVLERARIATTAAATRPPTVYGYREQVEAGGLISYGVNLYSGFHRAASYVYKILKGTPAADLPVEFPTKLELVINLKTARVLGLDVPPMLLARADDRAAFEAQISTKVLRQDQSRSSVHHEGCAGKAALPVLPG
jgi:putative tryptophan/tyrosine transport system substrate-binding protein